MRTSLRQIAIKWSRDVHHRPAKNEVATYRYKWTGEDLADFISVSLYTGLRISDVATFHIDRLHQNGDCHVRTTKTGRKVYTWIPAWLQERIHARVATHGPFIFGANATSDINVATDLWRRKLNRLWDLCRPWKSKPHPHRFRHTFARILLEKPGVTVRDVAEIVGRHRGNDLEALRRLGPGTTRTPHACAHGSIQRQAEAKDCPDQTCLTQRIVFIGANRGLSEAGRAIADRQQATYGIVRTNVPANLDRLRV